MRQMGSLSDDATSSRNRVATNCNALPLLMLTSLPPWEAIRSIAMAYLTHCNYQPLPLFLPDMLLSTLKERNHELILAILALASRFVSNQADQIEGYTATARSLVMQRVSNGPVELSTIQSLCILSLLEFNSTFPLTPTGYDCTVELKNPLCVNAYVTTLGVVDSGATTKNSICLNQELQRRQCYFLWKRLEANPSEQIVTPT